MKKLFFIFSLAISVFYLSFLLTSRVFATVPINTNLPFSTGPDIPSTVNAFYKYALYLGGILAFGAVVFGGVKYIFAAGNPSGQSEGKDWIKSALLGLVLLGGAYLILNVINPNLVNLNLPTLSPANVSSLAVNLSSSNLWYVCDSNGLTTGQSYSDLSSCDSANLLNPSGYTCQQGKCQNGGNAYYLCDSNNQSTSYTYSDLSSCQADLYKYPGGSCKSGSCVSTGGGTCQSTTDSSNMCSVGNVQTACSSWDPNSASQICLVESAGGNPNIMSGSDICYNNGNPVSFSGGLWQINLTNTSGVPSACSFSPTSNYSGQLRQGCGSAFSSTNSTQGSCIKCNTNNKGQIYCAQWTCSFQGSTTDYNTCVNGAEANNNQLACNLYNNSHGGSFCPWKITAQGCGISVPC
ncbi:MAG: hypothetical protein KGJ89_01575 [Patescibacteria group bacterium]|nr:hypothetical protein [Patescibacteria group bacterium]MDE2015199.1 hypothetical protein [Patescibacteria group bacterium]MDE2226626.1 hypothetical protein [Patescibacteria group bacterium]